MLNHSAFISARLSVVLLISFCSISQVTDQLSCVMYLSSLLAAWRAPARADVRLLAVRGCIDSLQLRTVGKQLGATLWSSAGMRATGVQSSTCHCDSAWPACTSLSISIHFTLTMTPTFYISCEGYVYMQIKGRYPCALHAGIWRSGGILSLILNVITRWRWVINFSPCPLNSSKVLKVHVKYEVGRYAAGLDAPAGNQIPNPSLFIISIISIDLSGLHFSLTGSHTHTHTHTHTRIMFPVWTTGQIT